VKLCKIFILRILFFFWDGATSHENSIMYRKDDRMYRRDEHKLFTVCVLSALEPENHDKSFYFKTQVAADGFPAHKMLWRNIF
jgi:hypothetical protein